MFLGVDVMIDFVGFTLGLVVGFCAKTAHKKSNQQTEQQLKKYSFHDYDNLAQDMHM